MNDYAIKTLLADLADLADVWAGFERKHASDNPPPQPQFVAGLNICADQLREALARAHKLAVADA